MPLKWICRDLKKSTTTFLLNRKLRKFAVAYLLNDKIILHYKITNMKVIKKLSLRVIVLLTTIFLGFSGCRKNDLKDINQKVDYATLQKQFFNTESTNDVEIKNLAKDIKRQDSIFKFLPAFIQKNGMPKWDKVLYRTKSGSAGKNPTLGNGQVSTFTENSNNTASQGVFFIPLQSTTSSEIKSYITAYKHNDSLYTYRLYNKDSLSEVHTTNAQEKSNLLNTEAVFGYFEKAVNNKDSVTVGNNANKTIIKNASIAINEKGSTSIKNLNTNTVYGGGSCDVTFEIAITYLQADYYINGYYVGSVYGMEFYMSITISCSGGGGGDCGCGGIGSPSGGSGDPTGGYDPNNPGGGYWWNSGTGWPWNNPYYYVGYDPNNPNPYNPGWGWWWNGGGGAVNPFNGKPLAPEGFFTDRYWEDPTYDNNSIVNPPCTDPVQCAYDQDGYRKNGPVYNYKGGTVQNYTNDNGGKYAIFTKTNGDKVKFPGATITDFGVSTNRGATTSNGGIHADLTFDLPALEHEYGHYLQALHYGSIIYNTYIVPASLWDMTTSPSSHPSFWTEVEANQFAIDFFGSSSDIALNPTRFPR